MVRIPLLIDGQAVDTNRTLDVVNPATGEVFAGVADADAETVASAMTSAKHGFAVWSSTPPAERRAALLRYADVLEGHRDELITALIAETGKPMDIAEYDFDMLTTCLRYFVEEAERLDQPVLHDGDGRFLHYMLRQPLGVVSGLLAWNFPLLNLGYKLGPALAAGCSAVVKPSELTPLASLRAVHLASEAGIPPGVINAVACSDRQAGRPMIDSGIPALVTMIGSTRSGIDVMRSACTTIKQFSVELGGNAPVIVYPDANISTAIDRIVDLKFANAGQVCVSPNRCLVHASVVDAFVERAAERIGQIVLGIGTGDGRRMGPMITAEARKKVIDLVDNATQTGAQLVSGGRAVDGPGYFMQPTLLRGVTPGMAVARDEVFGPVLSVIAYDDGDDPIAIANDTAYGLAAYVFTTDLSTGLRAARDIEAGSVCVNEPHYSVQLPHGGLKQSGFGKDCSRYGIEEYLTLKRVSILLD